MGNDKKLACPICERGDIKQKYTEAGLINHLGMFHQRYDVPELVELAKRERGNDGQ